MPAKKDHGEGGSASGKPCTCGMTLVNHFTVKVQTCEKHPEIVEYCNQRARDPGWVEFSKEYDAATGRKMFFRQEKLRAAEKLYAEVKASAAAEGRLPTFAEMRRAAGILDPITFASKTGIIPYGTRQAAYRDVGNQINADRALGWPPPGFCGDNFDAGDEGRRLHAVAQALPDDQENAPEYDRLVRIAGWLAENPECGRNEYQDAVHRIRNPPPRDPFDDIEPPEEGDGYV